MLPLAKGGGLTHMIADFITPPKRAADIVPFLMICSLAGFACMTVVLLVCLLCKARSADAVQLRNGISRRRVTAWFQKCVCLCDLERTVISRLPIAAIAIHAGVGERGGTRIPRKRIVNENRLFVASIIVLGLASAAGSASLANAAARVTFDIGNVAIGYSDGYMDNNHQYHRWTRRSDAQQYRTAHKDQYRGYRHNDRRATGADR